MNYCFCRLGRVACMLSLSLVVLLAACGSEGTYDPDPSKLPTDEIQQPAYPSGPYGKATGQVLDDITIQKAFMDPMFLCKSPDQQELAFNTDTEAFSLGQLYRGNAVCKDKPLQLLWIMVGAVWCGSCKSQMQWMSSEIKAGKMDKRVLLMHAMIDGKTSKTSSPAVTTADLWDYAKAHDVHFPQFDDSGRQIRKLISGSSIPMNLAIDLTTMKVVYSKAGNAKSTMHSTISKFFNGF